MKCPVCKSNRIKKLFSSKDMIISKCKNCNIMFQDESSRALKNKELIDDIYNDYSKTIKYHLEINTERLLNIKKRTGLDLKNLDILEIGSGNGALGYLLSQENSYTGFEAYKILKESLLKNFPELKEKIIFSKFPAKDDLNKKFDLIISNDTLEHTSEPVLVLSEMKKLLKPNGLIWLEIPDESFIFIKGGIRILTRMYIKGYPTNPDHRFLFTPKTFANVARLSGLGIEKIWKESIWGNKERLKIAMGGKLPLWISAASDIIKFLKIDMMIGANINAILKNNKNISN